jgi:glyoxylase-like metal-dependent hydrolase (beta-lactamase superfamily II)
MSTPVYELYAIRYATRSARRENHFIGGDPHDAPMPMDYFVWAAIGPDRTFVIDSGFNEAMAQKRGRTFLRCPVESLRLLGVDPDTATDVILTHLHYDHVGNFSKFPAARFHLQEAELHYATGRYMRFADMSHAYEVEEVCGIVRMNYAQRVSFYDSDAQLAPGISIHPTGGHTAGMQFVKVHTRRGWVVLASDASHFYENMDSDRPFTTAFHVGEMHESFERLKRAAPHSHIIPGHDPIVMQLYPAPRPDLQGIAVRLDRAPASIADFRCG